MTQVASHQQKFEALETKVVLISFEGRQFAGPWLRQMDVPFTMLIDETRDAYEAYGLERSFWRSWGLKNLWYYAKALLQGRKIERVRSDSTQLGGDFIVDSEGELQFVYPSHDPTDRPTVHQLMENLSPNLKKKPKTGSMMPVKMRIRRVNPEKSLKLKAH